MSESVRGKGAATLDWGFPLIGIVLALALAIGLGWLSGRESERRHQSPHSHQASAKARAQTDCISADPAIVFECAFALVEASEETANSEQDLSAQQRAATSALAAAVIAFATLIVTGIGVVFVKRTLDATLRAVEDTSIATKAMERQNDIAGVSARAWLSVELFLNQGQRVSVEGGTNYRFDVMAVIMNHGPAPASDVRFLAQMSFFEKGDTGHPLDIYCDDWRSRLSPILDSGGTALFSQQKESTAHSTFLTHQEIALHQERQGEGFLIFPTIVGCVCYRTPHAEGVRQTRFHLNLAHNAAGEPMVIDTSREEWWKHVVVFGSAKIQAD